MPTNTNENLVFSKEEGEKILQQSIFDSMFIPNPTVMYIKEGDLLWLQEDNEWLLVVYNKPSEYSELLWKVKWWSLKHNLVHTLILGKDHKLIKLRLLKR